MGDAEDLSDSADTDLRHVCSRMEERHMSNALEKTNEKNVYRVQGFT